MCVLLLKSETETEKKSAKNTRCKVVIATIIVIAFVYVRHFRIGFIVSHPFSRV